MNPDDPAPLAPPVAPAPVEVDPGTDPVRKLGMGQLGNPGDGTTWGPRGPGSVAPGPRARRNRAD